MRTFDTVTLRITAPGMPQNGLGRFAPMATMFENATSSNRPGIGAG
jgi:hypothetical protein